MYVSGKVPKAELRGERNYEAEVNFNSPEGTVTRIANVLSSIKDKPSAVREAIKTDEANIPKLIEVSESQFEQASELEAARKRADEIEQQLLKGSGSTADTDTDVKIDPETGEILERKQKKKKIHDEIKETLELSRTEKSNNYSKVILEEIVNDKLASDVENLTGINVEGWQVDFPIESFRHIEKRHGIEGAADHSMSSVDDYQRIADIIDDYTGINYGNISSGFNNADGSAAKTVELSMELNDKEFLTILAVPDSKKHTIHVVSAYKSKKRSSLSGAGIQKNPQRYVQDGPELTTSTNSVTLDRENSNQKSINTGEDRTSEWTAEKTSNNM